jgi:hypothetical protein
LSVAPGFGAQMRQRNSLSMFLDSAINCFKWQADYGDTEFTALSG